MRRLTALLFALLIPMGAWATVPEISGDGIDDGASSGTHGSCGAGYADAIMDATGAMDTGCELLADAPDQDRDGYTSDGTVGTSGTNYIDCDDTNRTIYPGVQVQGGCSGSDYKSCPTTGGSLTACQGGPLAECSHANYYVDFTSGNDGNTGTYASPFKTLAKVSGGSGGGGLPASPVTLQAGDCVYYVGSGTNTTSFTMTIGGTANVPVLFSPGASGSAGSPIVLKQYPGATGVQSLANGIAIFIPKNYITIDGIRGSSAWTSLNHSGSFVAVNTANDIVVKNIIATATVNGDNNGACIKTEATNRVETHHNFLRDCKDDGSHNEDNVSAIQILADRGAGEGADHHHHHNVVWDQAYSMTLNGSGVMQKHGTQLSDTGSNGMRVTYTYFINRRYDFWWEGSGLRAKGIFSYVDSTGNNIGSSIQSIARIKNDGTPIGYHEDNRIQYSTFINQSMLWWNVPILSGTPGLTFDHNIVSDNDATYSAGNNEGVVSIYPAGDDTQFTNFLTYFVANSNIYYNSAAAALNFQYMSDTGSGKNTGGNYTFTNWKLLPFDASPVSYNEDPAFNSQYECTSAHCTPSTIGHLAATEAAAASGPSIAQMVASQRKKKKVH